MMPSSNCWNGFCISKTCGYLKVDVEWCTKNIQKWWHLFHWHRRHWAVPLHWPSIVRAAAPPLGSHCSSQRRGTAARRCLAATIHWMRRELARTKQVDTRRRVNTSIWLVLGCVLLYLVALWYLCTSFDVPYLWLMLLLNMKKGSCWKTLLWASSLFRLILKKWNHDFPEGCSPILCRLLSCQRHIGR